MRQAHGARWLASATRPTRDARDPFPRYQLQGAVQSPNRGSPASGRGRDRIGVGGCRPGSARSCGGDRVLHAAPYRDPHGGDSVVPHPETWWDVAFGLNLVTALILVAAGLIALALALVGVG